MASTAQQAWIEFTPTASAVEGARATRAELILGRLQVGPCTGLDLIKAGGGTRYGARLKELRDRGHDIRTLYEGEWPTYALYLDGRQVGR